MHDQTGRLTQDEARARVARGAAHLDQVRPGWHERIDVGTLTLWDPCGCIVGQLSGAQFPVGLLALRVAWGKSVEYGFEFPIWMPLMIPADARQQICREHYQPLQDAWIEAIAARTFPVSASPVAEARDEVPT